VNNVIDARARFTIAHAAAVARRRAGLTHAARFDPPGTTNIDLAEIDLREAMRTGTGFEVSTAEDATI